MDTYIVTSLFLYAVIFAIPLSMPIFFPSRAATLLRRGTLLGLFVIAAGTASAIAGTMTGGATFPEQIVQEGTAIETQMSAANQLIQQVQMYENMAQNMISLPQNMINEMEGPLDQLYGLAQESQGLMTSGENIAQNFQNINPDFSPQATTSFENSYAQLQSGYTTQLNNILQAAGLQSSDFGSSQQAAQTIANGLQNQSSRSALLQAGASVGLLEEKTLSQMHQIQTQQAQAQAEYQTTQVDADDELNAQVNAFQPLPEVPVAITPGGVGFGSFPAPQQ